jgi:hypothetical protein
MTGNRTPFRDGFDRTIGDYKEERIPVGSEPPSKKFSALQGFYNIRASTMAMTSSTP